uniref:Eukaryotic initiation factor 4E-binding protein n=1 Tax=Acipenser schrenckii TaxID=111304 RepID=A0A161GC29_ACISC|nr:eukaryotic initiation factor 4E-binding protein [Acipenser schrenckii]
MAASPSSRPGSSSPAPVSSSSGCPGSESSIDSSELVEKDLPVAVTLLNSLTEQVALVTRHVQGLIKRVRNGMYQTAKGLSFLELRYQLLLLYLQDLTHLLLKKVEGRSLRGDSGIERLLELRTVLEKMRPIDQKLKYQIDKLVRTALTGTLGENDALHFKPNPENLLSKLSDSEEEGNEGEEGEVCGKRESSGPTRKYIPPRLAPMPYDGDQTDADRQKQVLERAKKRALSSSVIRELREQYSDAPEEIREHQDFTSARQGHEEQHRRLYEESMMVRLNLSKKERVSRKRGMLGMTSQLRSLTHFRDISALTGGESAAADLGNPRPKKKKGMKKKTKKKVFKRR